MLKRFSMMYTGLMAKIKLSNGELSLIDDEDLRLVSGFRWHMNKGYAEAPFRGTTIRLHRLILGVKDRKQAIDHLNGNKLDNRKKNLRLATWSQNRMNSDKLSTNKSGYKGVCWRQNTTGRHWCATIYKDYKQFHLGYFLTPEEAAEEYDRAALRLHGKFAKLNFAGER